MKPSCPAAFFFPVLLALSAPLRAQSPAPALSAEEALARLGGEGEAASLRWDPFFLSGVFSRSGHQAAFDASGSGEAEGFIVIDARDVLSVPAPYLRNGALYFPEPFVLALRRVFDARAAEDRSRFHIAAVVIDPGHGGKDPGALGEHRIGERRLNVREKDVALRAALMLQTRLRAAYPDRRVLLTRSDDRFLTLEERVAIANTVPLRENEAAVYISLHANASVNSAARGFEVWYLNPGYWRELLDRESFSGNADIFSIWNDMLQDEFITETIMIARAISRRVDEAMGRVIPSRGLKAGDWYVVRNARMPSVLVEMGFVTNEEDALLLTDEESLRNLVEAIYNGLADYIKTFDASGGFTVSR
ncbi:MAG: N-acetylmuramoyl-L-alanine amidase [Spirochaetaceae bacterium]|jgi:N-acetylmuramoyl-L-alanine amidase|nr:N-acetylmuramoyl-L-alanine amidase [Spirochaetaceae bacterium]